MHVHIRNFVCASLLGALSLTSCKKEDSKKEDRREEVSAHTVDQQSISGELDAVANDFNVALESETSFSGRLQNGASIMNICGASAVADTASNPRTITITYNGNNCTNNYKRTGVVKLSMAAGVRWRDAGAAFTISFQNFTIKRLSDNKSIVINGTQTHTNVTGGLLINLPNGNAITHTIASSNMSILFDDGSQRTWNIARQRTFTYNNGVVLTVTGNGTVGGQSGVSEWGQNRFGQDFVTKITQPLVFRQDCFFRLGSGAIQHSGFATATVTFGLNASGAPTTCPGSNPYFLKLEWTGPAGNTQSTLLPY